MAGDRSTDEVFMAAQEAVGAHRDSQGRRKRRHRRSKSKSKSPISITESPENRVLPHGSRSRSQSRPYIHLEVSPSDALEMQADEFLEATGSHSGDVYDEGYPDEGTASYDPFADVFMQSEDYPGGGPSPAEIDEALARSRKCFNLLIKDGRSLKEALQTYDKGKLILQVYQQQGYLDKANAILLCDLIMQHEFQGDPHTRLGGHAFLALAKSIIELFPNERIESYYVPYRYIDGQRKERARGRLLDKYEHRLKAFRAAGLIKSRHRRILPKSNSHQDKS